MPLPTAAEVRGAIATTRALSHLTSIMPQLATNEGRQRFLNTPQAVNGLLNDISVISSNANNSLVSGPVNNGIIQACTQLTAALPGTNGNPAARQAAITQCVTRLNTVGGPAIANCGRALTQCLNVPGFTTRVTGTQQDLAALNREITNLNGQINTLFPGAGQLLQTGTGAVQHGLSTGTNLLNGILNGR